ncbi:DNA mismatch repair protein [Desulfosporosinus sp. PR]|uniref:MutS family DNA mismatch repair protein n=1 Tax=Candidatus Desulfosporosinus nitrosoreducens TaxID=3401928 RepID=UPI0027F487C2|nr:DNA mismatch repair protein [Desulfosporosinus sp. PR]MDQ7094436.1 DNA mismatch repair protein [Desulfosporosinus sp. PR]
MSDLSDLREEIKQNVAQERYRKREAYYTRKHETLTQVINRLSNLRLMVFVLGALATVVLYLKDKVSWAYGALLITAILFVALVFWHQALKTRQSYLSVLKENYAQALRRLAGEWKSFPDRGEDFQDLEHAYGEDLDLFGAGSLYQWITTAQTFRGREKLREILTEPPRDCEVIRKRQEAIRELSLNLAWRQRFLAEAKLAKRPGRSPAAMISWAQTYDPTYLRRSVLLGARVLPLVTLAFLLLYFFTARVSYWYPLLGLLLQTGILLTGKQRGKTLNAVYEFKETIRIYEKMLERFEKRSFRAAYLQTLKDNLRDREGKPAFEQIRKLTGLADLIANRGNAMFLIVNILTLWDIQCLISLEAWKEKSGRSLGQWIDTIAELEALNSLALIAADHPQWSWPLITPETAGVVAAGVGHPLLENPVCNDLALDKNGGILLITGSNMSGKSTLLRTVGLNLVLAYTGAPVCAREFRCSVYRIFTCMRVRDNLEENISSFYAELLRIKQIVQASKQDRQIFFLLDEIFKGTNSQDRHAGAKVLIRQLSKAGAMGMVSTHDLELGDLEGETKRKIRNYHFREYYQNDQIYFDYKLRQGISTTRNAMYLIRMAGIEVES